MTNLWLLFFARCKECERDILFTVTAIKRHLDTKHSMTFKKYRAKHSLFADLKETFKTGTRGRKKKTGPKVPVCKYVCVCVFVRESERERVS